MIEIIIRTLLAGVVLPPLLAMASCVVLLQGLVGGRDARSHWVYRGFSTVVLAIAGVRAEVRGTEHIDPKQAYIVVCNHESNLDPFVLLAMVPQLCLRFVIKRQLTRIPMFGAALRLSGNVEVDRRRTGASADVRRIEATMAERASAVSLLFFAEGTRSRDGAFREFKKGAFATAIRARLPVLPIAVAGTYACLRPARPLFHPGPVALEVGAPIPTDGLEHGDRERLLHETRVAIGELRRRGRERIREQGREPGGRD
jgi:1-acyl-sn-glycerol-3-phosphate acyltransferase